MILFKVFVYGCAAVGWSFIFAVFIGKCIAFGNRAPVPKPRLTVVWRDTDVMQQAFTGVVDRVGDHHIKVTDENGWAEMVDIRDVIGIRQQAGQP